MKVIFLDFDGVINAIGTGILVDETYVRNLQEIIKRTGAKIVVSSARKNEFMCNRKIEHKESECYRFYERFLIKMGIEIFDYTPFVDIDRSIRREEEISAYLNKHPEIEEFVIIEDDHIINRFLNHQVFIEYASGILEEHIEPAINILNGQLGFYPPNYDRNETLESRLVRILKYRENSN